MTTLGQLLDEESIFPTDAVMDKRDVIVAVKKWLTDKRNQTLVALKHSIVTDGDLARRITEALLHQLDGLLEELEQ